MELKSGATFDAKIRDVDEKADIALIKIDAPVSSWRSMETVKLSNMDVIQFYSVLLNSDSPKKHNVKLFDSIGYNPDTEPSERFNGVEMI